MIKTAREGDSGAGRSAGADSPPSLTPLTLSSRPVRVVSFQGPGEVRVEERPEPELAASDDAVVRVEATGICGSDLHIYHGRVAIEPGFVIGHEYVGTVVAAGDGVSEVAVGDRVLGTLSALRAARASHCRRGEYHKCDSGRVFGHGATLGSLPGTQAEMVAVPNANLTLRRVPEGLADEVALFAGDVAGTGYHAVCGDAAAPSARARRLGRGARSRARRPERGPGGAGVGRVGGDRRRHGRGAASRWPSRSAPTPLHLTEEDVRAGVKELTEGAGWTWRSRRSATRRRWTSPAGWPARPAPSP